MSSGVSVRDCRPNPRRAACQAFDAASCIGIEISKRSDRSFRRRGDCSADSGTVDPTADFEDSPAGSETSSNGSADCKSEIVPPLRFTRYSRSRLATSRRHSGWTAKLPSVGVVRERKTAPGLGLTKGASQTAQISAGSPLMAPQCWQVFITAPFCAADVSPNGIGSQRHSNSGGAARGKMRKNCHESDNPGSRRDRYRIYRH